MALNIPKSLAACADLLYKTREERYALNRQVQALDEKEAALREHLINNLPKSQATGISGKLANAKIELKPVVIIEDWDKFYDYLVKNRKKGAFAMLQKRIAPRAIEEVWDAGKEVPGAGRLQVKVVSLTKR
jgi:hypothetical protein